MSRLCHDSVGSYAMQLRMVGRVMNDKWEGVRGEWSWPKDGTIVEFASRD